MFLTFCLDVLNLLYFKKPYVIKFYMILMNREYF